MAMNKKDQALRLAVQYFRVLERMSQTSEMRSAMKRMKTLCALALPMKYRFTRGEIDYLDVATLSDLPSEANDDEANR